MAWKIPIVDRERIVTFHHDKGAKIKYLCSNLLMFLLYMMLEKHIIFKMSEKVIQIHKICVYFIKRHFHGMFHANKFEKY